LKRAASAGEGDSEGLAIAKVHRELIEKARLVHGVMLRTGTAARNREVTVSLRFHDDGFVWSKRQW